MTFIKELVIYIPLFVGDDVVNFSIDYREKLYTA